MSVSELVPVTFVSFFVTRQNNEVARLHAPAPKACNVPMLCSVLSS